MKKLFLILLLFVTIIESCTQSSISFNNQELKDYFETQDIHIIRKGTTLHVQVSNSQLVTSKLAGSNANEEYSLEQFASIGAYFASKNIVQNGIDSISIDIKRDNIETNFGYRLNDVNQIQQFADTSIHFAKLIADKKFADAKLMFSDEILKNDTSGQVDQLFRDYFSFGTIKDAKLIGFKIDQGIAGLYINIYYDKNKGQTYIFSFILNDGKKIAGISIPTS